MWLIDVIRYRLRVLFRPNAHAHELDEEIRFHLSLEAMQREHAARGNLTATDARYAARRRFGNVTNTKEEARQMAGLGFFDTTEQDVRFALRSFRRAPGFTAVAVLTLAVGIGANTAIFSAVNAMLLRPLPFREPERLMDVSLTVPARGDVPAFDNAPWSYPKFAVFRQAQTVFEDVTAWMPFQATVRVGPDAERSTFEYTDSRYLPTLGVRLAMGRNFTPEENASPGGPRVTIITDALWQRRFNADSAVLGRSIVVDGNPFTIIGVLPPGFRGVSGRAELLLAFMTQDQGQLTEPWSHAYSVIARLKPGVTTAFAKTAIRQLGRVVADAYPHPEFKQERWGAIGRELNGTRVDPVVRRSLLVLLGAVGLVLLIACANVANLFLVRAAGRRREIAVRLALGISRRRLVSQLITETLLLASLGGIAGLLVARWGGPALRAKFVTSTADTSVVTDARTLMFVGLAVLIAGVATGLAPAWQAGRLDVTRFLRIGAREGMLQRSPLRASLLVVQGALSVLLLIAAGLFVRSLDQARHLHMGYDVDRLLIVGTNMRGVRLDSVRSHDLWARLTNASRTVPAVERVSIARDIPLLEIAIANIKRPPEMDSLRFARLPLMVQNVVMPGFFETMGTRILRGRALDSTDVPGSMRAAVVSNRFAQTFWPGQNAIGQCVMNQRGVCSYVVGVAEDIRYMWMNDDPAMQLYTSAAQTPLRQPKLFVRVRGDAAPHAERVRAVLQREMPGASYVTVTPYSDVVGHAMKSWQLGATVFVAFGLLAMLLAAIGLYSAISYNVAQRTHEMGVRRALGAQAADVIQLVMRQALVLGGLGVLLGAVLAFVAADRIEPMLFKTSARDPLVFALVIVAMLGVAIAASFVPARRAASVDPNIALRSE